jgi:hypothetical protein
MKPSMMIGSALALVVAGTMAKAAIVYERSNLQVPNNYVPFGDDGTPGRPVPGDHLGNQVTLAGTDRLLTQATVWFGYGNSGGLVDTWHDTYTVELYKNDGTGGAPLTKLATSSVGADSLGPPISVVFPFSVVVPNTFTVVVSSTHPTNTYFVRTGIVGPQSATATPVTGSAVNTIWYNTTSGWVSNSSWAMSDGAGTNYFAMTLEASPAPGSVVLDLPLGDGTTDGQIRTLNLGTLMRGSVLVSSIPLKNTGSGAASPTYTVGATPPFTITGPSTIAASGGTGSALLTTNTAVIPYGVTFSGQAKVKDGSSLDETVNITAQVAGWQAAGQPVSSPSIGPGGSYAGLSTKVNSGAATEAIIRFGSNGSAGNKTVTETWRLRTADETSGEVPFGAGLGPKPRIISEVLDLQGTGSDKIVLQMTYDQSGFLPGQEAEAANLGWIQIVSFDGSNWVPTTSLNSPPGGHFAGVAAWGSDTTLGDWGVDTSANVVWAVINHNSTFAVVPEPQSVAVVGLAALWLARRRGMESRKLRP